MTTSSLDLYQLPAVQQFVRTLLADINAHRSLIVLVPAGVDHIRLQQIVRAELDRQGGWAEDVALPPAASDGPITVLSEALGATRTAPDRPWTVEHLHEALEGRPQAIFLGHGDEQAERQIERWFRLMSEWAEHSQGMAGRSEEPTALCMFLPAGAALRSIPATNVYLAVRYWWMLPSTLEMQLLCRLRHGDEDRDSASLWREHVLPSLAGSDAALVDCLWHESEVAADALLARLKAVAAARGWTPQRIRSIGGDALVRDSGALEASYARPPQGYVALWAHGLLSVTPEYGIELHVAALAALDRTEEIRHRLWRAQARALLPLIDHVRLQICEEFTRVYGRDWATRYRLPPSDEEEQAVRDSPLACQWGHLEWLVKNCGELRAASRWRSLISLCRWVRNEIAHYRPVGFRDFESLRREIDRTMRKAARI